MGFKDDCPGTQLARGFPSHTNTTFLTTRTDILTSSRRQKTSTAVGQLSGGGPQSGRCVKGTGKVHPRTRHEGSEGEKRYSSTLSLTSALDGVGGQRYSPAALLPGKTRYPLYRRLGGPQGWAERCGISRPPTGIRSPDRPARSELLYRLSQIMGDLSHTMELPANGTKTRHKKQARCNPADEATVASYYYLDSTT